MSKINKAPVWFPPQFPLEGRLPQRAGQVQQNLRRQGEWEREYHDALCLAAGSRQPRPCCKTLHISLFFDGTGNNLNNDLYESAIAHPTNIARLFRATIGDGYAGGTSHSAKASGLTDAPGTGNGQYYKYYMPGVGTPFPEIGDLDYSTLGMAAAYRGEERINWALLMIIDALRRALGMPRLDNSTLKAEVDAMSTLGFNQWIMGRANRGSIFRRQLKALEGPLRLALEAPSPGRPKLLGIKLYVYGFSRGAAGARAFVNWLNELLAPKEPKPTLRLSSLKLPISVEYLGLLDTVVSVGLADIVPVAKGHMGWGDGSQEIPKGDLVKRCLHIVSSHEQRLSFPLESIRREDGTYPSSSQEVIYPGVHSDLGGGYSPGEQGKASSPDDRVGDGLLLSQIVLQDLYADAYASGAPFKVSKGILSLDLAVEKWRRLEAEVEKMFVFSPVLVRRFNAWRYVTLEASNVDPEYEVVQVNSYAPMSSGVSLEDAIRVQMSWITAWRIDRYAFGSLESAQFYRSSTDEHASSDSRARAQLDRDRKQAEIERRREIQLDRERRGFPKMLLEPGVKGFDPNRSKSQLLEAAEEFGRTYRHLESDPLLIFLKKARWVSAPALLAYWDAEEINAEHKRMKTGGHSKVSQLFPPPPNQQNHTSETHRGNVDETGNRDQPTGLLRDLFDDHVHDSRAWFLHSALNNTYSSIQIAAGREPWGSYFTERMVFFGNATRRTVALGPVPDKGRGQPLSDISHPAIAMGEQDRVRIQQDIAAMWEEHYATVRGASNV